MKDVALPPLKHWDQFNTKAYRSYKYGFPWNTTWSTFFTPVRLDRIYAGRMKAFVELLKTKAKLSKHMRLKLSKTLEEDLRYAITTPTNYLCQFNGGRIYMCDWEHFQLMYVHASFLIHSEDKLSLAFIFATCLNRFVSGVSDTSISVSPRYCPNPCHDVKWNPCAIRKNTINTICDNQNEELLLLENNFRCNCKAFYEWDSDTLECRLTDPCNREDDPWCGDYSKSTNCEFWRNSADLIAMGFHEFSIECQCTLGYMGPRCTMPRDACVENFNSSLPSGWVACGKNGECIPNTGTNYYHCECENGWTDDPITAFLDCNLQIDPCLQLKCLGGYCKTSPNRKYAVCICDYGFKGRRCEDLEDRWLSWDVWSVCQPPCGIDRKRIRRRACSSSNMSHCIGEPIERMKCQAIRCMVKLDWLGWSPWSKCSNDCDNNTKIRTRYCSSQTGIVNDIVKIGCFGPAVEYESCPVSGAHCDFVSQASIVFFICTCFLFKILFFKIKNFFDRKTKLPKTA
jgi:hypothetical protein